MITFFLNYKIITSCSDWIDWETKERSLKKSGKMKSLIGFPEWILNKTELDLHYKGVSLNSIMFSLHLIFCLFR